MTTSQGVFGPFHTWYSHASWLIRSHVYSSKYISRTCHLNTSRVTTCDQILLSCSLCKSVVWPPAKLTHTRPGATPHKHQLTHQHVQYMHSHIIQGIPKDWVCVIKIKPPETIYCKQHNIPTAKDIYSQGGLNTLDSSQLICYCFHSPVPVHAVLCSHYLDMLHII